ncbi:peptide deformylase [Clostridiaceae bacterium HSG29]|nr:peptide deformylase [Clostridiaceae bacterium HSG29]
MALRSIRVVEDPILRKKTREVKEINEKIKTIVEDMIETMYIEKGVGLAAPQVGILKRIFVIDIYDETGVKVFINSKITKMSGEIEGEEGCLSIPGKIGMVMRPEKVTVTALNLEGEEFTIEAEGFLARAICHESDHLDGILYIDKAWDVENV